MTRDTENVPVQVRRDELSCVEGGSRCIAMNHTLQTYLDELLVASLSLHRVDYTPH